MGLRELLILLLILAIVGVILRGLYVALRARRGQLRMALDKNIPQYDPDELLSSELPNGGARLVQRSFDEVVRRNSEFSSRDQAIPVLMDTVGEDDPLEETPRQSSVASARNAARQKHSLRTSMKPVHRPIDRMAAVAAAPVAAVATMAAEPEQGDDDDDFDDLDDLHNAPMSAGSYRDDEELDDAYDDRDDDDYEDDFDENPEAADPGDDDDEDDYYDDDDQDDDQDDLADQDDDSLSDAGQDADDEDDYYDEDVDAEEALDDDEDTGSWEEDQDGEDDEVEVEEFESVYGEDDAADSADHWYEEDAEPVVAEEAAKSGPRRWWQWAGEKLSGMGAAAERVAHDGDSHDRTQRAEPVLGLNNLDDDEVSAPRTVAAPIAASRPAVREPLDKSRQKELSLDHPDDDILFDREERAAEQAARRPQSSMQASPEDSPRREKPLRDTPRAQGTQPAEQRREKAQKPRDEAPQHAPAQESAAPAQDFSEVLVLNVVARPDCEIAGVDLLQVLLANQLRFGDMAIFHRHVDGDSRSPVLFSVANLVNPGTFDLNRISEFYTRGVCFFMTLPSVGNNMQAFEKMLDAAQQVRVALDADLKDDNRSVMTAQTIEHYRQRVRDFDLRQLRQPK